MKLLYLLAVVAFAVCDGRSTAKQPSITPHITSLTDKDAREKARVHPAFADAGRQAGVEIWRIENFDPVAIPAKDYGKFFKGDSYIVLKTTADKRKNLSWDIHYWIGSETTQDESGAAAILTVGLDDKFDGKAVQHRETMGYESQQFLEYFQNAVRYVDGGVASGFNHVTTNPGAEKRLFQVKGKKNVRVRQVDPLISSMNNGDCFILDIDRDILVYVGSRARNVEKLKAISMANQIRDQDHNGRGKVDIIDKYSSEVDSQKFFTTLGSGSKDLVPKESAGGDDQAFERSEEKAVILSEVSDSSGSLKVTPLSKPYRQDQLKPQETYILDTVSGSIYVWIGKQASKREKSEAMTKAQQYLSAKKYPSWVHIARIPQGTEPAVFKQYFTTWKDVGMSHSRLVRSASDESSDSSSEEDKTKMYKVEMNENDKFYFKEIDLKQKDLTKTNILLLDDGKHAFVWFGKMIPVEQLKSLFVIGDTYNENAGKRLSILGLRQGFEPKLFKSLFNKWDSSLFPDQDVNTADILRENEVK